MDQFLRLYVREIFDLIFVKDLTGTVFSLSQLHTCTSVLLCSALFVTGVGFFLHTKHIRKHIESQCHDVSVVIRLTSLVKKYIILKQSLISNLKTLRTESEN